MKYNIKINEVKSDDSQIKGFATVTFGDSILVRNIAIIQRRDSEELFVSMPSYRTNEVTEKGEPVYRDVCNPITKEFYDELVGNILEAFNQRQSIGKNGMDIGTDTAPLRFTVKVTPMKREDSSLRGLGRIFLEDNFVISNVKMVEGKNGMFISMPDYRTEKYKDGKPVYREIAFPVTKEFREQLFGAFEQEYAVSKDAQSKDSKNKDAKSVDAPAQDAPETEKKQSKSTTSKSKSKDKELAMAR